MKKQTDFTDTDLNRAEKVFDIARKVFELEREALNSAASKLDHTFLDAVDLILKCKGKIIITGLGKSGIAGKKIAATFSSTGLPALFLHSGEAGHGDLGVVAAEDVILALSYSGETSELVELMPRFKILGVSVIALTGNTSSMLAETSDVILDVSVPKYPWPYGILPTASNAVTVAMGDALAIALLISRGMDAEDFASLHPGGLLGRKMLVRVGDIMHKNDAIPIVNETSYMKTALMEMTAKRLGMTCVTNNPGDLVGVVTDGDLRRLLARDNALLDKIVSEVMTENPKTIPVNMLSAKALHEMETYSITSLPVVDNENSLVGVIHMHDIIKMETNR